MKKFFTIILSILSIVTISINQTQSVSVADFTPTLDKKISKMETTQEKIEYIQSFTKLLSSPKYTKNKDARLYKEIKEYCLNMLNVFEYELKEGQTSDLTTTNYTQTSAKIGSLPHLSDNLPNVDIQKVRNAILSWHNEERRNN